jgi:hypothetical protein
MSAAVPTSLAALKALLYVFFFTKRPSLYARGESLSTATTDGAEGGESHGSGEHGTSAEAVPPASSEAQPGESHGSGGHGTGRGSGTLDLLRSGSGTLGSFGRATSGTFRASDFVTFARFRAIRVSSSTPPQPRQYPFLARVVGSGQHTGELGEFFIAGAEGAAVAFEEQAQGGTSNAFVAIIKGVIVYEEKDQRGSFVDQGGKGFLPKRALKGVGQRSKQPCIIGHCKTLRVVRANCIADAEDVGEGEMVHSRRE